MKAKILLCSMLILGSLSYAAETTPTDSVAQEVMSEVKNIEAEYKNGRPSIQLQGTTAVMYYESGKILLELSPSLDGTVNSKIYYENGQLMQVEDRNKSSRSVKVYDKAGNLISDITYSKEHEIRQIF